LCVLAAQTIEFENLPLPVGDEKHQVRASKRAVYNGKSHNIKYNTVVRSGDELPLTSNKKVLWPFGTIVDQDGNPVMEIEADGSKGRFIDIAHEPDYTSYLQPASSKSVWQVNHFESPRPGSMYVTELTQNTTTCALTAVSTYPIGKLMCWAIR
jgi:hypothetical protein